MWGDTTSPACRDATRTPLVQVARRNRSRRRSCACPELAPGGPAFRKEPKLVPPAPRAAPVIWVPFEGSASRRLVAGRRRSVVRTARSRARAQAFSNADLEPWASWQGAIECASPLASMSHTCRSGGAAGRPTSRPKGSAAAILGMHIVALAVKAPRTATYEERHTNRRGAAGLGAEDRSVSSVITLAAFHLAAEDVVGPGRVGENRPSQFAHAVLQPSIGSHHEPARAKQGIGDQQAPVNTLNGVSQSSRPPA
jgi:hypothetical protein